MTHTPTHSSSRMHRYAHLLHDPVEFAELFILDSFEEGYEPAPDEVAEVFVDLNASDGAYGNVEDHTGYDDGAIEHDHLAASHAAARHLGLKENR